MLVTLNSLARIGAVALMLLPPAAIAQQRTLGPPSGSVRIEALSIAFLGQGQLGGGTLSFRGRNYPISVGGLGVGGIGASKLTATGRVYGLRQREDFAGMQCARERRPARRARGGFEPAPAAAVDFDADDVERDVERRRRRAAMLRPCRAVRVQAVAPSG